MLKREYPAGLQDYYRYCNGEAEKPSSTPETAAFWNRAEQEARQITLGSEEGDKELDGLIKARLNKIGRPWVLIGGPPCQAYSIVGRARNKAKKDYVAENDNRHFLYKDYLRIIKDYRPTVFVMENVKGILYFCPPSLLSSALLGSTRSCRICEKIPLPPTLDDKIPLTFSMTKRAGRNKDMFTGFRGGVQLFRLYRQCETKVIYHRS